MMKTKLLSLKHKPSEETLDTHFLKFDKIMRELEGNDCFIDETDKVCHLYMTMKPNVNTDTGTAFSLHRNNQRSNWKMDLHFHIIVIIVE
jgi:hypothetical protein